MLSDDLNDYLTQNSTPLSSFLQKLASKTESEFDCAHMLSGPLVSLFLKLLVKIAKPKLILDLGTFTGLSALTMAEALETGRILSCETSAPHLLAAKNNFKNHPKGHLIELFEGSVLDCLESLTTEVDFVFLDADKYLYLEYYQKIMECLKPGGLLIIDDTLWKGRVLSPNTVREKRMDQMNKMILEDPRVENLLLPIRNGINLIYKL